MTEYIKSEHMNYDVKHTLTWLGFANQLIAFIHIYGPLYDNNYFSYILILHNLVEHYLLNNDEKIIGRIYLGYKKCIHDGKSDKETFEVLRFLLQQLPNHLISEVDERHNSHIRCK